MKNNYYDQIMIELKDSLSKFDEESIDQLLEAIIRSNRIFLAGTGRSGLMVKGFAMRLMHLGLKAFVVGETTTPGISNGDLLIIGSGSGETGSVSNYAREARKHNAKIGLITIFPDSTIGKLADIKVLIRAPTSKNILDNGITSIQPMGSLYEQSLLLLLDGLILKLMEKTNANPGTMWANHANLE
jgi:6-phospho-3-hexuloisomerase